MKKILTFEESKRVSESKGFLGYRKGSFSEFLENERERFNQQAIRGILAGSRSSKGRGLLDIIK